MMMPSVVSAADGDSSKDTEQDLKDAVENAAEDSDDRDFAELLAFIISGAVVAIVILMVCLYCICSKMGQNGKENEKKDEVTN